MRKDKNIVFEEVSKMLQALGAEAKERRKSRLITMGRLCRDACISRGTLILIEKGSPNVSIGLYFDVLYLLGYSRYLWISRTHTFINQDTGLNGLYATEFKNTITTLASVNFHYCNPVLSTASFKK